MDRRIRADRIGGRMGIRDRTLKMPTRFADMTEEEREYCGSDCSLFCTYIGSAFWGAGVIFSTVDCCVDVDENKKKFLDNFITFCSSAGAVFTSFGVIVGCCRSVPQPFKMERMSVTKVTERYNGEPIGRMVNTVL